MDSSTSHAKSMFQVRCVVGLKGNQQETILFGSSVSRANCMFQFGLGLVRGKPIRNRMKRRVPYPMLRQTRTLRSSLCSRAAAPFAGGIAREGGAPSSGWDQFQGKSGECKADFLPVSMTHWAKSSKKQVKTSCSVQLASL